jgi:sugar phosphate isomerase/epimerase
MKVGLCTIAFRDKLLDAALDSAQALGFDGVEIWGREPHLSEAFDENRVRTAARMAHARGLEIPVLGSYYRAGATSPRESNGVRLEDTIHTGRCLHVPIIRVWASDVPSAAANADIWHETVDGIRRACDLADDLEMLIAAEMHSGTLADTGASARKLVERVDRPNFRLNFQVAAHDYGGETALARLEAALPSVAHVHAQNYAHLTVNGEPVKQSPLRRGVWDYGALVGRLKEAGYDGYLAVEFPFAEGDRRTPALADDIGYLRSVV